MTFFKIMGFAILWMSLTGTTHSQPDTIQKIVLHRINGSSQQIKPYVILISADGFRSDYTKKYNARNLLRLSKQGATAEYMLSSYPSLTFPNHYSIITGLYSAHHGLVDNSFYDGPHKTVYDMRDTTIVRDGSWYGGTPLWVLAEKQKMLTASFYWVGSEAAIQGVHPTYYYHYNESIPMDRRLQEVKKWLQLPEDRRPHLITFYFPEVDHESHMHGPDARETEKAVQLIDGSIGQLAAITDSLQLPVNFIFVSDHGMAAVDMEHTVPIPPALLDSSVCRLVSGATLLHVYVKDPQMILPLYHQLQMQTNDMNIYLPQDIPEAWHYGKLDDGYNRIGDMVIVSRFPKVFKIGNRKVTPGKHGFDPVIKEMHATFLAWGPQIKKSITIQHFENVNVFPFVAGILGLPYSFPIDGNPSVLKSILR
jgi:predicted AlkP superfamily pyrophosphatase or phosphodiesterase